MYLHDAFVEFLKAINPKPKDVKPAKEAHTSVRDFLASEEGLDDKYDDSFLAGSYERDTAISPVKDVDVVCLTTYTTDDNPAAVLRHLRTTLEKNYEFDDTVPNRRSVLVKLDGTPLTMDIVPAIATGEREDPIWVPDKKLKKWIKSHPYRHITLATDRNQASAVIRDRHMYLSVVKMLRWWRHIQLEGQRHPKGFLIEVMCLDLAPVDAKEWADAVLVTMDSIAKKYGGYRGSKTAPELTDPALPGEIIRTKLTVADFDKFLEKLDESRAILKRAIASEDNTESAQLYRKVFGKDFPVGDDSGGKGAAAAFPRSERNVRSSPTFA